MKKRICSCRSKFFPLRVDIVGMIFLPKKANKESQKLFPFDMQKTKGSNHSSSGVSVLFIVMVVCKQAYKKKKQRSG